MPQQVEIKGVGIVEFPDGMNDAAIAAAIKKNMPQLGIVDTGETNEFGLPRGPSPIPEISYGAAMRKIGDLIDKGGRAAANAITFGLRDKAAGGLDYLTGGAPSYDAGVKAQRAETKKVKEEYPTTYVTGEILGGLGGGYGLAKSGLTLAGRVGQGLLPRVLGYGVEGATYGAAHGAGNTYSDNPMDYVENAGKGSAIGLGVGSALPVGGSIAGAVYRAGAPFVGQKIEGAGRGASALMRTAAQADETGLRNLSQLGPEAMLPDAGPAMLGLAQGAGTGTGTGRTALVNALNARERETGSRLAQSLEQNLGPSPLPSRVEAGLSGDRAYVNQEYEPILQTASAVNTRRLANELDTSAINLRGPSQRAVREVRDMLDIPGNLGTLDPHPRALLSTRHAIDGLQANEANPQVIRELTIARQAIDAELTRAVPGIKAVDAQINELSRQSSALQRGGQVLDTGKTAIRPQELLSEIQQGAVPSGTMIGPSASPMRLREGARAEIDRRVGTNVNDLGQLERTFGTPQDWNYQKLGTIFGEGPRDAVAANITANRIFRDTNQKVTQGSQSAQRLESADAMKGAAGGNIPHDLTSTSLGFKAVNAIAKLLAGQSNATTRDQVGELLSKQGSDAWRVAQALLNSAQTTGANARSISELISSPRWIAASTPQTSHK